MGGRGRLEGVNGGAYVKLSSKDIILKSISLITVKAAGVNGLHIKTNSFTGCPVLSQWKGQEWECSFPQVFRKPIWGSNESRALMTAQTFPGLRLVPVVICWIRLGCG